MRPPRKTEMLRLQEQYKTDAKIAEALGVEEYLISYWRRKKKLPRHSAPKFSRDQITELWLRFGDDFRGGRELNISKAAFYGWRRKYGLLDRPAVLKLEQLELRLPGSDPPAVAIPTAARTAVRKILDHARGESGNQSATPDWRLFGMTVDDDNIFVISPGPDPAPPKSRPAAESLPLGVLDHPHWVSEDMGQIVWQLVESRAILPGQLLVSRDHAAAGLGGVGCLCLPEEELGSHPRTVRVEVTRRLGPNVEVEDILLSLMSHGVHHDWQDAAVEFLGSPVERLSIDRKVRLCELAVRVGARTALCAFDDVMRRHYGRLLQGHYPQCHPDRTASYDGEHFIEGRALQTMAVLLDREGGLESVAQPTESVGGVLIGPYAMPYEIELTAAALKGRRLAKKVSLLVCPATPTVYRHAQRKEWQDAIIDAGGSFLDVGLVRRLGIPGLLALAGGGGGAIYVTGAFASSAPVPEGRVYLASVRTILNMLELEI